MIHATKEKEKVVRQWMSWGHDPGQRIRESSLKESMCGLSGPLGIGEGRREEEREFIPDRRAVQRPCGRKQHGPFRD